MGCNRIVLILLIIMILIASHSLPARNVRLGLWVHALFLFLIVLGWAPAPVDTIATLLLLTVFLPHFLVAQKLGGFTSDVWSLSAIIILSAVSVVATLPLSLLYASLLHRFSARVQRYWRTRSEQHAGV